MNNHEKRIQQYEEMDEELHKIQKAIRMIWRQEQKKLLNEWIKKDLK